MKLSNWLHAGTIGDVWAAIPSMNTAYKKYGKKINLYLLNGHPATYYEGATHPTKNEKNQMVMLNTKAIEMMIPLFKEQECINDAKVWEGETINVDLNKIRMVNVGMPGLSINRWYFYVFHDLSCDLSNVWLTVPDAEKDLAKGKVVITLTERYRNELLDYSFLKPYEGELVFIGTMREYNNFCMRFDLNIRKLNINNFLECAQAIKQSKFHITNQTQAFQLSEGLKHPRMLEVCIAAPNCIPIGENAHDYLYQIGLEYHFHELYGDLEQYIKEQIGSDYDAKKEKILAETNEDYKTFLNQINQ